MCKRVTLTDFEDNKEVLNFINEMGSGYEAFTDMKLDFKNKKITAKIRENGN